MRERMKILFVCTGNTCRSPLAEAIARKIAIERGLSDLEVASAGTSAHDGSPASDGALLVGMERNMDLGHHRAQTLSLDTTPAELRAEGGAGNVPVPHKGRVAMRCDALTPLAARVGAVNTFWVADGRMTGDNTDVGGFSSAATTLMSGAPADIVVGVIGAGGAAAAVLTAVESWTGCRALVYNRTRRRADAVCAR